jgi:hypothetical protein
MGNGRIRGRWSWGYEHEQRTCTHVGLVRHSSLVVVHGWLHKNCSLPRHALLGNGLVFVIEGGLGAGKGQDLLCVHREMVRRSTSRCAV